ncbi:MAG: DegT/DnrJ/EryC1/StrS family aminotransferase [Muribaculaceae bacterium]|nr:DegT/DnrJ/EryC1/StrS family aminotransferase [Muribaculaceae bacterium]
MKYPFLSLSDITAPMADDLIAAATATIRSGRYLHGPATEALEKSVAKVCGVDHCVAVSNGLDAIRLSFRALLETGRIAPGDEVIVPANTYIASILPLTELGLRPVLAEPKDSDFNLDARRAESLVGPRTRAVLLVHLYGTPCWDAEVMTRLVGKGIWIVEDNAQAIGALAAAPGLNGTRATGGLGHIAATSFYPTKNIGALGDAGAVTTPDETLAATVRALANYGSDRRYHNIFTGYNNRMDEIQAAMLEVKMRHLDEVCEARSRAARAYGDTISHPLVTLPSTLPGTRQVWHQYVVRVPAPRRDRFREWLADEGVGTDIHYAIPPHLQPCYYPSLGESYPVTERLASEVVSLPIAAITEDDARAIAGIINRYPG